jgi:hypothetical protein
MKATGKTRITAIYEEVHKSYKTWIIDYEKPFINGHQLENDLKSIRLKKAAFKDGDAIRALIKSTVLKVETMLKITNKVVTIPVVQKGYLKLVVKPLQSFRFASQFSTTSIISFSSVRKMMLSMA